MSNIDDDDDDDDYVTIGTPFDIPEEDEPLPKATKVEDQIVTDKQGRRRLHGAFTGGFSAGYFNTVGSKEGWSPSAFKSSRSMKNDDEDKERRQVSKPEDFMDEEDFGEYGIAPKKLKTVSSYNSADTKFETQKQSFLKAVGDGKVHSAIPGGIPLDDLLIPRDHSVGIQLLKKLGWKPGQGIGEKVELPSDNEDTFVKKKLYGCALPPKSKVESVDMQLFTAMLAPKDIQPIKFDHKDNLHGIGYSGLLIIPKGPKINTGKVFRPNGMGKKGICGQAFGIGVFEDDDEYDVYGDTALSRHDMTMCDDVDPKDGWTGTTSKPKVYKDCLTGFVKSLKKLSILVTLSTPMKIPNVIPRHIFPEDHQSNKSKPITNHNVLSGFHARLSSQERSNLLGEVTKTMDDVSHWTLKWDKKDNKKDTNEDRITTAGADTGTDTDNKSVSSDVEISKFSSRWDKDVRQIRPKQKIDERTEDISKATLHDQQIDVFKPFSKYPEKQARYELFLSSRNKPDFKYQTSITEWEKAQEVAEFSRAAVLYQPLASSMSNRFVPADFKENEGVKEEPADKKAAEMGMFGKLTRTVLEWHPDPILCKRMNIPNPFPNSSIKGVPSRNKKQTSIFSDTFIEDMKMMTSPGAKQDIVKQDIDIDDKDEFVSRIQKNKIKTLKSKTGPLSHLNIKTECLQLEGNPDKLQPSSTSSTAINNNIEKEEVVKPSIDIFKAIFENSDSESSDDEDVIKEEKDIPVTTNLSETTKSIISSPDISVSASESNKTIMKSNFVTGQSLIKDDFQKIERDKHTNVTENINNNVTVNENEKNKKFLPLAFLNTGGNFNKGLTTLKTAECSKSSCVNRTEMPTIPTSTMSASKSTISKSTISDNKQSCVAQLDTKRKHDKTKHKKTKKEKKSKKHKKHKKYDDSDSETEKKYKKKKSKKHRRSSSSSSDDSFTPSSTLLLEKIKKHAEVSKRPTAADFM